MLISSSVSVAVCASIWLKLGAEWLCNYDADKTWTASWRTRRHRVWPSFLADGRQIVCASQIVYDAFELCFKARAKKNKKSTNYNCRRHRVWQPGWPGRQPVPHEGAKWHMCSKENSIIFELTLAWPSLCFIVGRKLVFRQFEHICHTWTAFRTIFYFAAFSIKPNQKSTLTCHAFGLRSSLLKAADMQNLLGPQRNYDTKMHGQHESWNVQKFNWNDQRGEGGGQSLPLSTVGELQLQLHLRLILTAVTARSRPTAAAHKTVQILCVHMQSTVRAKSKRTRRKRPSQSS